MKKLFFMLVCSIIMLFTTSCTDGKQVNDLSEESEITITFIAGELSEKVKIKKSTSILVDNIPSSVDNKLNGLFYDNNFTIEYKGEIIESDTTIYIKSIEQTKELTQELSTQILSDYLYKYVKEEEATISDVEILHYYGEYNNAYVFMFNCKYIGYFNWLTNDKLDDVIIKYCNSNKIIVWYEENFYSLKEAFENNYLSKEDIIKIADYQKMLYPFLYN